MQINLVAHPATVPADPPFRVWANVDHVGLLGTKATANIWFGVGAPASRFVIPHSEQARRRDGLWETTCFEAFLRCEAEEAYREWNFAPSGDWAAFDFAEYREGRTDGETAFEPYVRVEDNLTWWALGATMSLEAGVRWKLGLSAVLEEKDGTKSYWALAHPPGDRPDFHHPDCFAAKLA